MSDQEVVESVSVPIGHVDFAVDVGQGIAPGRFLIHNDPIILDFVRGLLGRDRLSVRFDRDSFGQPRFLSFAGVEEQGHLALCVSGDQVFLSVLIPIHNLWISADTSPGREADLIASRLQIAGFGQHGRRIAARIQV